MPLVRAREVLSDTNWHRIYTVQDGEGATLDVEVSNQTDGAAVVSLAASKELKTITDADIVRRARVPAGADYSPRKNVYPVGYSIYAKTSIAGVVASVFGLDRVSQDYLDALAQFVGRAGTMGTVTNAVYEGRIWQDTARTTPAVVNSVVGSIRDDLARFYFEQGTLANKPFLRGTPTGPDLFGGAGAFSSGTGWTLPGGLSISGGKLNCASPVAPVIASHASSLIVGHVYRITYTIESISAGDVRARVQVSTGGPDGAARTVAGTYVEYLTCSLTDAAAQTGLRFATGTIAQVENLEIYDVTAGQVVAPYYLSSDGTDFLVTPGNVDFSSSDEVTAVAAFQKYVDASSSGIIAMNYASDAGFAILAPDGVGQTRLAFYSRGTASRSAIAVGIPAPAKRVVAGRAKISVPNISIRINGVQAAQNTASHGTGNYGNAPLYLFRIPAGGFFPGDIYFWTAIDSQRSDADTAVFERLGARASGVTL